MVNDCTLTIKKAHFEPRERNSPVSIEARLMVPERECTFFVPATAYNTFMLAIEESENSYITVKILDLQPDAMKTPEEIRKRLKILTDVEKAKYARVNGFRLLFKDRLSHIIPSYARSLSNPNEYRLYEGSHKMKKSALLRKPMRGLFFSSRFLESVVVTANHWFFITSFCVFVHAKKMLMTVQITRESDCKKARVGKDIFEVTIRFSSLELLCLWLFFGHVNESKMQAFFGSSISVLPETIKESYETISSKDIFTKNEISFIQAPRLLNQYVKNQAGKRWMLISRKYKEQSLIPAHPLFVKNGKKTPRSGLLGAKDLC
ncbi:hypothetical protein BD560DRAFT_402570 [Blakeslea trispora]|nr:hypothetical protein BD560DRAFT_402570 [Blakeslea trispora]